MRAGRACPTRRGYPAGRGAAGRAASPMSPGLQRLGGVRPGSSEERHRLRGRRLSSSQKQPRATIPVGCLHRPSSRALLRGYWVWNRRLPHQGYLLACVSAAGVSRCRRRSGPTLLRPSSHPTPRGLAADAPSARCTFAQTPGPATSKRPCPSPAPVSHEPPKKQELKRPGRGMARP